MIHSVAQVEDSIIRIKAMLHQEYTTYRKFDYLMVNAKPKPIEKPEIELMFDVDSDCRLKMVTWCYQIIDFCKFHRETAEIAMSYLDRFLNTNEGSVALFDRSLFQLATMTALYTAVKINEAEAMDPNLVASLSRGLYNVSEIEEMEREMLSALDWRVNPPTALAFCRELWQFIPDEVADQATQESIFELTTKQTELSVQEYSLVEVKASTIAFCSIMNSFESLLFDDAILSYIGGVLASVLEVDCNNTEIIRVQNWMYDTAVSQHKLSIIDNFTIGVSQKDPQRQVVRTFSPRCIVNWF